MSLRIPTFIAALSFGSHCMAACEFTVEVGDGLQFSTSEIVADANCDSVKVTITHTGKSPAAAMGHNWVLSKSTDFQSLATAGMGAGIENNFLPPDDPRIIAHTKIVGGGESDSVVFPVTSLGEGDYVFFCSFPGHWAVMKGSFKLAGA